MTSPPRAGYHKCALNIPRASDTWASAQDPGRVPVPHARDKNALGCCGSAAPYLCSGEGHIQQQRGPRGRGEGVGGWGHFAHATFLSDNGEVVVVKVIKLKVTINFKYIITWWIAVSAGTIDHRSIRTREPNAWLLVVNCKVMQSPAMQGCKPICLSNYV